MPLRIWITPVNVGRQRCDRGIRDQLGEGLRDGDVPVGGRALVTQGNVGSCVPEAMHQLGGGCAGDRGKRGGAPTKVVEVQAAQSERADCGPPDRASKVGVAQSPAPRPDELQPRGVVLRELRNVFVQVASDHVGDRDGAPPRHGLRRPNMANTPRQLRG